MRLAKVTNQTRGTTVGERVEIADNSLTRFWGLLGRPCIDAGGGLWIKPSSGVHTMGMRFSIDVIGLDKRMRVTRIWKDLVPYRVTSLSLRVTSVVELAAGQASQCAVEIGDLIEIAHIV